MICTQMRLEELLTGGEVKRIYIKGYQQDDEERQEPVDALAAMMKSVKPLLEKEQGCSEMQPVVERQEPRRRRRTRSMRLRREEH